MKRRHPRAYTRRQVRRMLLDDVRRGVMTPPGWALAAYDYLGGGVSERAEAEYVAVRQQAAAEGLTMPGAPGQ